MSKSNDCLIINKWETPATHYSVVNVNNVSIRRIDQKPGYYLMEGIRGYKYYHHKKRIPVTCLNIGRETVMIDDPLNYYGMVDLAKHCKGNVLIAGLGLGLILHGLQSNKDVIGIHVIENNIDVISLMTKNNNIPVDNRIKIINNDFWEYIESVKSESYDTVLLDIWWGDASSKIGAEMYVLRYRVNAHIPGAKIMIWGLCNSEINPAVVNQDEYNDDFIKEKDLK